MTATPAAAPARRHGTPLLTRCDPTALLVAVVLVPLALLRTFDPAPLLVLWLALSAAVVLACGLRPSRLLLAQLPFVSFGLSLVLVNAVTRDGAVLAVWGAFEVTDVGLRTGAALAVRTLIVGVCAAGFLAVTDPARLLVSLHQVARLPVRVTYALLASYRLLDDLPAEWTTIRRAHAVRAPVRAPRRVPVRAPERAQRPPRRSASAPGPRRLSRSPRALGRAAFVLLATSIRRAERIAISLESRGLGALARTERTSWHTAQVTWRDGVLLAVVVGSLLVTVVAGR